MAQDDRRVIVHVDGQPVYADEVDRELRAALGEAADPQQVAPGMRRRAAEQVVDRRLVLKHLTETKQGASEQDVDFSLEQLKNELKAQGLTMTEYFRRGGWTEADFRRHLKWTLAWNQYLATMLTDENLQKYFDRYRADFDGTQVRVAHLLLKVADEDEKQQAEAIARAKRIRAEVVDGKLPFSDAVRQFSQAPTAAEGGEIGFIERRQPMPEAFSAAAFRLKSQEISEPVVTPFGVHLIQCLEIKPGQQTWRDAAGELRPAVTLYLFRWIADWEREKARIEWVDR